MKKIFVICPVRMASLDTQFDLEEYAIDLEEKGNEVHLPHRDTIQNQSSIGICGDNLRAIKWADEVHVFYTAESSGTHFDMGMAFALGKKVFIVENVAYGPGKSFARMLVEWKNETN